VRNAPVPAEAAYSRHAPIHDDIGEVHVLICALDYKRTSNPLTCTIDGNNFAALCEQCNAKTVHKLFDEEATVPAVKEALTTLASKCGPDDYFIFYYSGHGTNLPDQDGDEADHQDEAFCLVDDRGQVSFETCLRDDEFADIVTTCVHTETRVLMISDCCHSGTVADLSKDEWDGYRAISISGCTDKQTSGDTGRGGICTHSLLLAIDKLQQAGDDDYSVGALYNATLREDERVFDSAQDITIQAADAISYNSMAWPLIPPNRYQAPLNRAAGGQQDTSGGINGEGSTAVELTQVAEHELVAMGVSPAMVGFVHQEHIAFVEEEYSEVLQLNGQKVSCPTQ
jgi:hypothetical protein